MTTMAEKEGDVVRLVKFDGTDDHWHEWSVKTLALATIRGFKKTLTMDTKPCTDATYKTTNNNAIKKLYDLNNKAYQLLVMSCSGIAFGLVNQAKTTDLQDGDAFLAWKYLTDRYSPNQTSDLIALSGQFNKCSLKSKYTDPDEWFIELELLRTQMRLINTKFTKQDEELIAHILDKLPLEYSEVVTTVEGQTTMTLDDLKSKIRVFYKRKFKCESTDAKEIALIMHPKFKGTCRNCGRQGHRANKCRSRPAGSKLEKPKTIATVGKGLKCFNCNKFAGHLSKDCPEPRCETTSTKSKESNKTGMFVGVCKETHCTGISSNDFNNDNSGKFENLQFCGASSTTNSEHWLADTGATSHITMSDTHMTNVEEVDITVMVGNGNEITCTKRGTL